MGTKTRILVMKLLSLTGVFTFVYSVIYVGRRLLFNTNGGFSSFAFFIALLYAGFFAGLLIIREESAFFGKIAKFPLIDIFFEKKANARNISILTAYLTLIVPLASAAAVYKGDGMLRLLFELPLAFLIYFAGLKGYFKDYGAILSKHIMYAGAIIILIPVFVAFRNPDWNARPFIFGCAYSFIVISMVVRNQDTLDTFFLKKGVNMYDAVKKVRGFNVLIVIAVFTLAVILFNFNDTVVFVLNLALHILKQIFVLIIKLMMANPEPEFKGGQMPPNPDQFPFAGEELIHPWSNFFGNVLSNFVILFLAYKIVFLLVRRSRYILRGIASLIKSLFKRVLPSYGTIETDDYSDEIETVKPVRISGIIKLKSRVRAVRKNLKQISDPVEKIRYIYGTVLGMLAMRNINISASDTTREILKKAAQLEGVHDCLSDMTILYDKIRYGDRIPGAEEVEGYERGYDRIKKYFYRHRP